MEYESADAYLKAKNLLETPQLETTGETPLLMRDTVYDDLQVTISLGKLPPANAPTWVDYDFGLGGETFKALEFGIGDNIDLYVQTNHKVKLLTALEQHIHFDIPLDDNGKRIKFQITGVAAGIGSAWTSIGTIAGEKILNANHGKHNYMDIGNLPDTLNDTISSVFVIKLKRIAASIDDYTSGVYIVFADMHVQHDTLGSKIRRTS